MKRPLIGILAATGLIAAFAAGAIAQSDTGGPPPPAPDGTSAPNDQSNPSDQSTAPDQSNPDETPPDALPPDEAVAPPPVARKTKPSAAAKPAPSAPAAAMDMQTPPDQTAIAPPVPTGPPPVSPNAVLLITGLDKITGRATQIAAALNVPVHFATLTITARYCYSTPPSETPETSAFVQIDDHRPDQAEHRVFSGWMYASSPGLNGMEHPLYDVWVISCKANAPGQEAAAHVAAHAPVKVGSPDATDSEGITALPEGSGQ